MSIFFRFIFFKTSIFLFFIVVNKTFIGIKINIIEELNVSKKLNSFSLINKTKHH